ncbi:TRAP transporter large permease [Hydrogenophaga taeniospiralis]|uniref:TRAP transporter large permease n=1 Tax=Hydrogenophaga TaxID=47420 RepID=UPI001CFAB0E9|nr:MULTISPECIES: TRAP transporter large permease [Hydrogenophaga]MCB4365523.1 TRAP transporter large permease [Hydrogenophaga taeniospiralis]UJW83082.1 TRAP transporter large permease [Hydrogenophaga sp. SL48]
MSITAWILTAGFTGLVLLGVPFAFAIALSVIAVLLTVGIEPMLLPQTIVAGTQSFTLLAIPFFMLAGELMSAGGLSQRLVRVAEVFVRHLPGGLGLVVIVAALIFAAVSGSAPATTAAIGAVMIPAMTERGYSRAYATALVVSAGVLAPLIPPSIAFVIWGVIAEQSIAKLFLSGVLPGLLMALGMAVIVVAHALRSPQPREPRATWPEAVAALREGMWALLAPVVVLGGIYGGAFTPTEAAVVACLYALFVGVVIERRLSWSQLPQVVSRAMAISAIVMAIIVVSSGFGFLVAQEQLANQLASWLAQHVHEKWMMLLALNIGFFLLAAVMDEIAIMVILGPMLISIANQFGVDPIHFGAMMVTNVAIGMAAPPIGYCLFVGMAISGVKLWPVARAITPFVLMMLVVLAVVTYVPTFALALVK